MAGALTGIRILELSQVLAGPFCGYQFALLGADVVKIELPQDPDCARGRGPRADLNAQGLGLTYQVQGGNKRALALDFRTDAGRAALLRLVASADVVIENFRTGRLEALGLGYTALRAVNDRIILCSMTGYGGQGGKADQGAYDNTVQAASGIIDQCGGVKPAVSFVDYASGYAAAFAVSAALLQRDRSGQGCHITTSMLEVALTMMAPEAAAAQVAPDHQKQSEAGIAAYDTAEGRLMLGAFKPAQYRRLGRCLADLGQAVPMLAEIHDWSDVWACAQRLRVALQGVFIQRSAAAWQQILTEAGLPAEVVVPLRQAVADPQLAARGYFATAPGAPDLPLPLGSFRMSTGGPELNRAPPKLGQDSRDILQEAGLGADEIAALMGSGVAQ